MKTDLHSSQQCSMFISLQGDHRGYTCIGHYTGWNQPHSLTQPVHFDAGHKAPVQHKKLSVLPQNQQY